MVIVEFGQVFYLNDLVLFAKKARDHVSCVFSDRSFPAEVEQRLA